MRAILDSVEVALSYADKLKDPRWQQVRLRVMERDGFACQHCGDKEKTLCVHHLIYGGAPWDIPMEKLITLCEDCHERAEGVIQMVRLASENKKAMDLIDDMAVICQSGYGDSLRSFLKRLSSHPELAPSLPLVFEGLIVAADAGFNKAQK